MTHRPWPLIKRVIQLMHDGFEPYVRRDGSQVWARTRRDGRNAALTIEEAGPVTEPESELVSDIMHNRRLEK